MSESVRFDQSPELLVQNPCVKLMDSDIISSIADGQLLLLFFLFVLHFPPSARVRILNNMASDIALRVCCCAERVHEGVKLFARQEKKGSALLVFNKAFDFPALENPMLSEWRQRGLWQRWRGGRGEGFSSIRSSACDTKKTRCPLCLFMLPLEAALVSTWTPVLEFDVIYVSSLAPN